MSNIVRRPLLVLFAAVGLYLLTWAFQSASFSVPTEPLMSEIYKTQALLLLPLSLLFFAVGILFFICLEKNIGKLAKPRYPGKPAQAMMICKAGMEIEEISRGGCCFWES